MKKILMTTLLAFALMGTALAGSSYTITRGASSSDHLDGKNIACGKAKKKVKKQCKKEGGTISGSIRCDKKKCKGKKKGLRTRWACKASGSCTRP